MPPKKNIFADKSRILHSIHDLAESIIQPIEADISVIKAERRAGLARDAKLAAELKDKEEAEGRPHDPYVIYSHPEYGKGRRDSSLLERDLAFARDGWVEYSLETFSGRTDLSESERQEWRKAVRQLDADGLVERNGHQIRLTKFGREAVR